MTRLRPLGVFWFCLLFVPAFARDKCAGQGQITGQVVNEEGMPVSDAAVSILSEECVVVGIAPVAKTDERGRFSLSGVPVGLNGVYAQKTESGYPDMTAAIYGDGAFPAPKVVISAGATTSNVVIHLGKKAGVVRGEIIDVDTLKPVITARIKISLPDNDRIMLSMGPDSAGHFSLLMPVKPVRFVVSAPGYETWQYSEREETSGVIRVESGANVDLSIRIHKLQN